MIQIHAHICAHTALQAGIIYTYTNVYIHTHSKKSLRVNLLSKCLGGPDMKCRNVGNSVVELILFFLKKYLLYPVWNLVVSCILIAL